MLIHFLSFFGWYFWLSQEVESCSVPFWNIKPTWGPSLEKVNHDLLSPFFLLNITIRESGNSFNELKLKKVFLLLFAQKWKYMNKVVFAQLFFVSYTYSSTCLLVSCIKRRRSAALVVVVAAPSGTSAHWVTNESYKCVSFASKDGDRFQGSDAPRG